MSRRPEDDTWARPEAGWISLDLPQWLGRSQQYISGDADPDRVTLRHYQRPGDRALMTRVWVGPRTEGPPLHVHGGCQAALLDECMGISAWSTERPALAGTIQVEFRAPVPYGHAYTVEAFVEREDETKLFTRASLMDASGKVLTVATGTFVRRPLSFFAKMADMALETSE